MCDESCGAAGCDGNSNKDCLKCPTSPVIAGCTDCATGFKKVIRTAGAEGFECVARCPKRFGENTGGTTCTDCSKDNSTPLYDYGTKKCAATGQCSAGTVEITLANYAVKDVSIDATATGASTTKVCGECDKRCKTCKDWDARVCNTCQDSLLSTTMTDTAGRSYVTCTEKCPKGKFKNGSKECANDCLDGCSECENATECKT